jgi:hypothetical protein
MSSVAEAGTRLRPGAAPRRRSSLCMLAATAWFVCYGAPEGVTAAETPPDLAGYWMIPYSPIPPRREPTPFEQAALDLLPPDTVLLRDSGLFEMPPGDYGGLRVRPQALAQARTYDPEIQRAFATTCQPPSVIHAMQGPFPIEIFQATELIVIRMEYYDLVRIVFLDRDDHPTQWPHSPVGHSIGRWDGDTLVVDTRFLSAATIFNNGLDHSSDVRLTERFRLSSDRSTLLVTQLFEDPQVFEGRAARLLPLERGEGHVYPYACDPTYGLAIESREQDAP